MDPPHEGSRRRRDSIHQPPDLSELMTNLDKCSDEFMRALDSSEPRMREVVQTLEEVTDKVKQMQERKDKYKTSGAVVGNVGFGLLIFAFTFTEGVSFAVAVATAVLMAGSGAAAVLMANITKKTREKEGVRKVEDLGKEFMAMVDPLKNTLEDIQDMCVKLEDKSSEGQAGAALMEVGGLQTALSRVTELTEKSSDTLKLSLTLKQVMDTLWILMTNIFNVTATPEKDRKTTDSIVQLAEHSQKVVDAFNIMKQELRKHLQERGNQGNISD